MSVAQLHCVVYVCFSLVPIDLMEDPYMWPYYTVWSVRFSLVPIDHCVVYVCFSLIPSYIDRTEDPYMWPSFTVLSVCVSAWFPAT